jgi:hypothetical protein
MVIVTLKKPLDSHFRLATSFMSFKNLSHSKSANCCLSWPGDGRPSLAKLTYTHIVSVSESLIGPNAIFWWSSTALVTRGYLSLLKSKKKFSISLIRFSDSHTIEIITARKQTKQKFLITFCRSESLQSSGLDLITRFCDSIVKKRSGFCWSRLKCPCIEVGN